MKIDYRDLKWFRINHRPIDQVDRSSFYVVVDENDEYEGTAEYINDELQEVTQIVEIL